MSERDEALKDETGWLIEIDGAGMNPRFGKAMYWCGNGLDFSDDPFIAIRFCRKCDADNAIAGFYERYFSWGTLKAVEHLWFDARSALAGEG